MTTQPINPDPFADIWAGNEHFVRDFSYAGLTGSAAKGLAIVTCMDSRIAPLSVVGMSPGDVKIMRNAGARVTDDVLRTLVLATYLLNVNRVLVMPHTECRMAGATEDQIHEHIESEYGVDTRSLEFRTVLDQREALRRDLDRIKSYPYLAKGLNVCGAIYDVRTGLLTPFED